MPRHRYWNPPSWNQPPGKPRITGFTLPPQPSGPGSVTAANRTFQLRNGSPRSDWRRFQDPNRNIGAGSPYTSMANTLVGPPVDTPFMPTPERAPVGRGTIGAVGPVLPQPTIQPIAGDPIHRVGVPPMETQTPRLAPAAPSKGFLSKIGDFLGRTGVGEGMVSAGASMMEAAARPGGTFMGSLGTGIQAGVAEGTRSRAEERGQQQLMLQQQAVDRNRAIEEEERAVQMAAQGRVREVLDELGLDATEEDRVSVILRAATEAAASGNPNLANAITNIAEGYGPATLENPFTNWSGATPGHAIKEGDEWVPATSSQAGVAGIWERRQHKVTGEVQRQFVPTGAEPEEVVGRDVDVGKSTAAAAIEGMKRLKPFIMDMAGLDAATGERVGGIENLQGLLASTMDQNIGETDSNWLVRAAKAKARELFVDLDSQLVENILSGQLAALAVVNPMVRWLSGAQMTNQETSRYYKSLIPSWGDNLEQTRIKMLGMETLALAMSGDLEAIERLGGLGQEIAPRQTDDEGRWLESEEEYQSRLQSYAEGQAAQIYNRMAQYDAERLARIRAAGPQFSR